jgi:hypothetical protein
VAPAAPAVPLDAELPAEPSARAKFLVDRVRARRADLDRRFFEQGLDLRALSKPLLYRALGHKKFEDLLKDKKLVTRVQAWKLISIVDSFDMATAQQKGIQWCYAVLKYAAVKAGGNVRGLLARNPVIPGVRLRLLDAKASEIEAALRHQGPGFAAELKHAASIEANRLARSFRRKGARSTRARTVAGKTGWLVRVELTPEDVRRFLG